MWKDNRCHTFGLELQLLLSAPGVVIVLSQLFCHRLHEKISKTNLKMPEIMK